MATTYREDLVRLITNGTPKADIMAHFIAVRHLKLREAMNLLKAVGVMPDLPDPNDDITEERRRYLQDLSIS